MKKEIILYMLLVILIITIIGITYICINNKKNKPIKENSETEQIEEKTNNSIAKWYYKKTITENMPDSEENYNLSLNYIEFKELSIEICYDLCYSVPYTINDNTLSIESGEYFSGEYKIKYENDEMYLEQKFIDDTSLVYVFSN